MKIRKLSALLLVFVLSLSILTACGNSHKSESDTEEYTDEDFETMEEDTEDLYEEYDDSASSQSGSGASMNDPAIMSVTDIDYGVYTGAWIPTGIGLEAYLPSDWVTKEVSASDAASGIVFLSGQPAGDAKLTITQTPAAAGYDVNSLYTELSSTYTSVAYAEINGMPGVIFDDTTNCVSGFSTILDDKVVTCIVSPPSSFEYESFSPSIRNIVFSIRKTV